MINIEIICIGKIKELEIEKICTEYEKRISKYAKIKIIELPDESLANASSILEENKVKEKEAQKVIDRINKISNPYIIALDPNGYMCDSVEFSKKIEKISTYSSSSIIFIIGGSLGISESLLKKANEKISFSKMTFPHQLFRVILLEQIYRSFKISKGETYHK